MGGNPGFLSTTLMVIAASAIPGLAMSDMNVGGHVTVATDYRFRGVSQTMSGAALQAELDVDFESGWYGYAWGSNVDFTGSNATDDGANIEFNFGIGYIFNVADDVTLGLEAMTYIFPGTEPGYDYDYGEWQAYLTLYDQHSLMITYSDNVFGSARNGTFYAFNSGLDLSHRLSLGLELGYYDLNDSYRTAYRYATLSVAGELQSIDWQLSYITTTDEDEELFYASTIEDRFVLELTMSF